MWATRVGIPCNFYTTWYWTFVMMPSRRHLVWYTKRKQPWRTITELLSVSTIHKSIQKLCNPFRGLHWHLVYIRTTRLHVWITSGPWKMKQNLAFRPVARVSPLSALWQEHLLKCKVKEHEKAWPKARARMNAVDKINTRLPVPPCNNGSICRTMSWPGVSCRMSVISTLTRL